MARMKSTGASEEGTPFASGVRPAGASELTLFIWGVYQLENGHLPMTSSRLTVHS